MNSCVKPQSLHKNRNQCEEFVLCIILCVTQTMVHSLLLRRARSIKWRRSMNTKKKNPSRHPHCHVPELTPLHAAHPTAAPHRWRSAPHLRPTYRRSTKGVVPRRRSNTPRPWLPLPQPAKAHPPPPPRLNVWCSAHIWWENEPIRPWRPGSSRGGLD